MICPNDGGNSPRPSKKACTDSVAGDQSAGGQVTGPSTTTTQPLGAGSPSSMGKKNTPAPEWVAQWHEAVRVSEEKRAASVKESLTSSPEKDRISVPPPTPLQSTEAMEENSCPGNGSEADMSLDSAAGEGGTQGGITATELPALPPSHTPVARTPEDEVIAQAIEAAGNMRQLIERIESRARDGSAPWPQGKLFLLRQ
ncbi:hypothetical protein FRC11_005134 [Ceratobasidium sp. 423]|nr:hypothetical protein FRC11_005134 [Ceratobasidium sp. 423]